MKSHLLLFLMVLAISCGNGIKSSKVNAATTHNENTVVNVEKKNVSLADPFILLHNGKYYAYGTGSASGIPVLVSDDLLNWVEGKGLAAENLALHKDDVWGGKNFWAPEVYFIKEKFYMFFSAEAHVCVATSGSPLGPFVQEVQKPMLPDEQSIDNTLFVDDDGKYYMYFDRFMDGLSIWVVELEDNLSEIKPGTMHKCINVSQKWEEALGRVNEGCFVIKHNGIYYMTYSGNDYRSQFYGIGCATAASPAGPWTKYHDNPLLQNTGGLVGVGHSAMFKDKAGKMKITFHAHNSKKNIHPRGMYISDVYFMYKEGKYKMHIDENYTTPVINSVDIVNTEIRKK